MITHIRMKNFKSWKDSGKVELALLTGFFGTNSSGKSSLLQMLLLLKQTVGSDEFLFFGDEDSLVNLGSFREVIHGHKVNATLELEFGWKIGTPLTIEANLMEDPGNQAKTVSIADRLRNQTKASVTTESFTFNASILWGNGKLVVENKPYLVKVENEKLIVDTGSYAAKIYGTPFSIGYEDAAIDQLSSEFKKLFKYVYPLGPTRVHPQRYYHWEKTHPKEIDLWGNKAVDALLSARVQQLTTAYNGKSVPIEERISKWLQKMELAHSFRLIPIGDLDDNNYEIRIQKTLNSAEVTLADMGHGVSDVFPLLVHCCYVPEGSTLILEQPGVHLHPMAQADLADLFLEVIMERNLQILVESHSEHLLTRLQRRIAEKQIDKSDVALYFCRNIDGESTKEQLEVTESGDIKNWPENFFGDVMGDMFAMTDVQVEQTTEQNPED